VVKNPRFFSAQIALADRKHQFSAGILLMRGSGSKCPASIAPREVGGKSFAQLSVFHEWASILNCMKPLKSVTMMHYETAPPQITSAGAGRGNRAYLVENLMQGQGGS
jgi:hypothetical protein